MTDSVRILFAMFQGGGNIPLIMPVVTRLVARGHQVRILVEPGVRQSRLPVSTAFLQRIQAARATLVPFPDPEVHPLDHVPRTRGLIGGWVPKAFRAYALEGRTALWAPVWAERVAAELRREVADVVVIDFVLLGAIAAAEAAGITAVVLMHNVLFRPLPGVPPVGPGWLPARSPIGLLRDTLGRATVNLVYTRNVGPPLNRARALMGLPALRSPFEQYDRAERVLVLTSLAFDYEVPRLPANVRHVGTPFDDAGLPLWRPPWSPDDARPLVLVSLSTLEQGQAAVLQRVIEALAPLAVRGLVTLGPALDPAQFTAPANVRLEAFVPHSAVLPHARAMVTQCGLGTLTKALAHGVPLVCLPLVGDQPDNAARVVARGAGVRLERDATPEQIRAAIQRVLTQPRFGESARRIAGKLAKEDGAQRAAEEIEAVVRQGVGTSDEQT
ncbi:MAG TPA: glycosyltransferase [Candidatus Binatia bacterium]|nr:glycosyltransferase [Candidatus Binatia bacterium]